MTVRERLIGVKLKATHQRIVILEAIIDCMTHPTADLIYEKLKPGNPSISLATVYKTLETFVQAGLISKVSTTEGMMRYDANLSNHGHIYCHNTDEIIDYYDENGDFQTFEQQVDIKGNALLEASFDPDTGEWEVIYGQGYGKIR